MAPAARKKVARTSYHVAWICPVSDLELMPAVLMLDEQHERPEIDNHSDENIYEFGSAAGHNIVLATCRQGMTGNVNVSSITAPLFKTFPNIRMTLLVGIGGGVPQPDAFYDPLNDLRLGDVVVGWPTSPDGRGSVVYYEYGRWRVDGFEITSTMDKPHTVILNALPSLKLDHELGRSTFHEHMAKLQSHNRLGARFKHPGLEHDKLFQPHYKHVGGYKSNCKDCDRRELVERESRDDTQKDLFIYHQGRIATGNSVIMDGEKRDSISAQCGEALCIEMEAAGVEVNSRCLVIRGISDYADSHKGDRWRSYAAGKAVAFARELLGKIPAMDIKEKMASGNKHWLVDRPTNQHFTGRRGVIDKIIKRIASEDAGNEQRRFVLTGMGGQGKSEICLHAANEVRNRFWGIFWVDVNTQSTAEEDFSEVADALGCPKTIDAVRKALSNLQSTKRWLLILDNADNPQRDCQIYMPSGNRGAILITSRNPQCERFATTGGHEQLDSLEESECIELLQKTAQIPEIARDTEDYSSAVCLVKHLGYHTLAILHAGSYIATTRCRIADYLDFLRRNRRQLLEKSRGQGQSRYDTVYATFGASIEFLEQKDTGVSEQTRKDALTLLEVLSTFHHMSVPLDLLEDAWKGVQSALKTPKERDKYADKLTAWHVAQVPDLVRTEKDDLRFRITEAVTRLESLALVRTDQSARAWKSVSMHLLVHGWVRDRQSQPERNAIVRMTIHIVALSNFPVGRWRPYYHQLRPHLKLLVHSDEELVDDAAQSIGILQVCVQIAWLYYMLDLARDMYEFTGRIFQRLGLHNKEPTNDLRGIYSAFAVAIEEEGSYPKQALRAFEAIARLDEKTLDENDSERLDNMRNLGVAYIRNAQTKEAIAAVEKVVKARQELGEEHEYLLAAQHDLGLALSNDGQIKEAITLLERVVRTKKRSFPEEDHGLLPSQQVLAIAYLRDGQIAEATLRLEELAEIYAQSLGDEHHMTATTQHWLANAYNQGGRLSEAVALYERVVNAQTSVLGERHPYLLMSQHDLACVYLHSGRTQEAIDILERVIDIRESILEENDLILLTSRHELARAYLVNGRTSEAIGIFESVVDIKKLVLEEKDHELLASRNELARAYLEDGRTSEAVWILESVVDIRKSILEEKDLNLLVSQHVLARAYLNAGRNSEAVRVLEQVKRVEALLYDEGHPSRIAAEELLDEAHAGCDRSSSGLTKTSLSPADNARSDSVAQHSRQPASGESDRGLDVELEENERRESNKSLGCMPLVNS